jgi:hypothetical protein
MIILDRRVDRNEGTWNDDHVLTLANGGTSL